MHKVELLASAKDLNSLEVALKNGVDAIYIGGDSFGIEAVNKSFSNEDLEQAIKLVHENGKKIYIAINVMPHNEDLKS